MRKILHRTIELARRFHRTLTTIAILFVLYLAFLNHVEPSETGLARDEISGEVWRQSAGWHVTSPWTLVNNIDTRPMRVAVLSGGRGYSGKLVQFNPEHFEEFLETEGFWYYWWSNRLSFNWGHSEEYRGMRDIMRGYAYGAKRYRFFTVIEEYSGG